MVGLGGASSPLVPYPSAPLPDTPPRERFVPLPAQPPPILVQRRRGQAACVRVGHTEGGGQVREALGEEGRPASCAGVERGKWGCGGGAGVAPPLLGVQPALQPPAAWRGAAEAVGAGRGERSGDLRLQGASLEERLATKEEQENSLDLWRPALRLIAAAGKERRKRLAQIAGGWPAVCCRA
ncbi:uncharacterized protein [Equus caballus]|uniref:uncharacterized protein n=1 Tax=Equus caballus TaxID=9796 RepID=UPI0038B29163